MSTVAIHQPNFFPWLGYFDKISRCDHFVFLDHVQFPKTGGSWSNRVQLLVSGEPKWVTAPIVRTFDGVRAVNEIEFAANQPWRQKLLKTLRASYGRATFYSETIDALEPLVMHADNNLARYNRHAIVALADYLGMTLPAWHWSSQLGQSEQSTELLVAITQRIGGNVYLSGGGAGGYQQDSLFERAGLTLLAQNFRHPRYAQGAGAFVEGLSIIDALMHCGRLAVGTLVTKGSSR